jgi:hypothetical protein
MKYIAVILRDATEIGRAITEHKEKHLVFVDYPEATDVIFYPASLKPNRFLIDSLKAYQISEIDEDGNFSIHNKTLSLTGEKVSKLLSLANVFGYQLEIKTTNYLTVYFNRL